MAESFVSQRHPIYSKYASEWTFFIDSFNGGSDYLKAPYLFSHTRENPEDFVKRKERAFYYNYCEKSVEIPISFVYQPDILRSAKNGDVSLFLDDADLKGTSFSTLMQEQVAIPAGVYSHVLVVVDVPETAGESPSRLADIQGNTHPYVSVYSPLDVMDWSMTMDGCFRWVRVREEAPDTLEPTGIRQDTKFVYRTWTSDRWILHNDEGVFLKEGAHSVGEVPAVLVRVKDNKRDPVIGRSMISDIAYVNRTVFNWCSLIDEYAYEQAFNILAVPIGAKQMNVDAVAKKVKQAGTKNAMTYDGTTNPPSYLSPPTSPAEFLVTGIDSMSQKIAELAKMQDFSAKKTSQSGVAKAYDFHDQNAALGKIAQNLEDAEKKILRLVHLWAASKEPEPDDIEVEYPDDFNVRALNEEIDDAIAELEMDISPTYTAMVKKRVVDKSFPDMLEPDRKKVFAEIDAKKPDPITDDPNLFDDVQKSETSAVVRKVVKNA